MATRQSPSRESSVSRPSLSERPSLSRLSNPDVFSDDFALSSRANSPDTSPVESIDSFSADGLAHESTEESHPHIPTAITSPHLNIGNFSRPSSTSKGPVMVGDAQAAPSHRAISSVSHSDAATQRSASISSHLSIPRAQSPYTGPTAPSQPYAMYPQVTRASSITSESTIRPTERPYVSTGGPQHPYGMYPQNTVEEEDNDVPGPASTIQVGFPGMGQIYAGTRATGHDLGDIVGSDGHVEQLPPYTRYADNTIAKSASDPVPAPVAVTDSPHSPASQSSDSDVNLNPVAAPDAGGRATEYNEKSKSKSRLRRKVCWGISLCVWLLVVAIIVLAATLGGVIGGVIGNNRASDAAADNVSPTATTTVWLDAGPLPTGVAPPDCTPGEYDIPTTDNSLDTNACVADQAYGAAWECLKQEPVPFKIKYVDSTPMITLGQPGPGTPKRGFFNYGPQVPDLNGSFHTLGASIDKDDPKAGGTMYFNVLYNKLTVVPAYIFSSNSKRSLKYSDLEQRQSFPSSVSVGDTPFFCWFNQTLLEFFIYSNLSTAAGAANSTAYAYPSSTSVSTSQFTGAASTSMAGQSSASVNQNQVTTPTSSAESFPSTYTIPPWPTTSESWILPPTESLRRRQDSDNDDDGDNYAIYPKQIRLIEKRAPGGNDVTPYCQQMEVKSDGSVCEIEGAYFQISETEPSYSGAYRRWNRRQQSSTGNNLDSDCACQWYSI